MKEPIAFDIIERPDGKFTLRHFLARGLTQDHGPFDTKELAVVGMTRIITPTVYHYNAIGTLLDK